MHNIYCTLPLLCIWYRCSSLECSHWRCKVTYWWCCCLYRTCAEIWRASRDSPTEISFWSRMSNLASVCSMLPIKSHKVSSLYAPSWQWILMWTKFVLLTLLPEMVSLTFLFLHVQPVCVYVCTVLYSVICCFCKHLLQSGKIFAVKTCMFRSWNFCFSTKVHCVHCMVALFTILWLRS